MDEKQIIAQCVERYLRPGEVVNLGIGIPTLVANYIKPEKQIWLHSENGILGVDRIAGPDEIDPNIVNAGKMPVTIHKGASFFDSAESFAMIRGGHVDVCVIGALEVEQSGRVANWRVPGQNVMGVGGAMELLEGARRVIVAFTHTTKDGKPKLVKETKYPLTSLRPVDLIVTELGVFEVVDRQLVLIEVLPGATIEEIRQKTEADFTVNLKPAHE
jgi:3-oxoacid CoA-transferase B subunit